jgi:hypothetical protein
MWPAAPSPKRSFAKRRKEPVMCWRARNVRIGVGEDWDGWHVDCSGVVTDCESVHGTKSED